MGLKLLVNATEDFTGEFRKTANTQAQWKMNDSPSGDDTTLHDSSGHARNFTINGWSGTTASTRAGKLGKFFRFNTVNPATEKTHLRATNTGDFFTALGKRIVAGGWIYPTTYSVGTTFVPIFSTRSGPGNPLFYLSLRSGRLRNMLYDSSGTLIHDVIEPEPMGVVLKNNGAYFIGTVIDLEKKTVQSLVCDRGTGDVFKTAIRSFTGELNPSCTADIVMGMYADSYYFAGGFDDWFYETDSDLTIDDLEAHFLSGLLANGADVDSSVDAISNLGSVTLKQTDGVYAESGVLYTRILDLGEGGLAGAGKIQLVGTVDAGITSISEVRTRTSDSLEDTSFSDWEAVGADGVIQSPNLRYIQIQSISYVIQVMDLSVLTGWEHESFGIGDVVTVDDKDLGIRISTRIIRMDYNVQEPWKTVIELSTKLKELGDSSASWEKAADTLSSSDLLDRQEMKDLVVNNHLLNSRADDGFSYWQNSGFEVDGENGASGNASFKCVGALNTTKTLSQEVYPATRSSYTVSASIATENLKKGANGRVGIELIIEYEDGSEETRFVELY